MNLIEMFGSIFASNPAKIKITIENIVNTILVNDNYVYDGPWIAGGMGRQLAIGETDFSDIDVWFKSPEQLYRTKERLQEAFGSEIYETFTSDNAITYQCGDHKVQLIRRAYYPTIDEVFKDFDFTCCMVGVDMDIRPFGPGIDHAHSRILKLGRFDPTAFIARYGKYVGYGYVMDPKEFLEIIERPGINYEFDGTSLGY